MITDRVPRRLAHRDEFVRSDQMRDLPVPADESLRIFARQIEIAMKRDARGDVKSACAGFLGEAARFYGVRMPSVTVLAARPLRVREGGWSSELFGDYAPATMAIRVWMRTAVLKHVTSFGTFFSTLCHEFCHHLDCYRLGFRHSPHTRGFYARAAVLYHHARGTPARPLVWRRVPGNRWSIDWQAMRGGEGAKLRDKAPSRDPGIWT